LPHLFALLGIVEGEDPFMQMDAQVRRRRTHDAVKRVLLRESINQPLMLILEDLHWIDEETQGFLNLLADGIASAPVLLLVNYRPEYSHSWNSKTYYTQLRLDPLGRESAEEMLSALLGDEANLAPFKRIVIEKTEGNPLFMEEIVQALVEDGSLKRNGAVRLVRPIEQLRIPSTVQDILTSRLDRLPPEMKDLLQTLAVIGIAFPLSLVSEVVQLLPHRIDQLLRDLQAHEFIYEQPGAGDIVYTFKHALTHNVAYNSVLVERRRRLHESAGIAIEVLFAGSQADHLNELVYHFTHSSNSSKAAHYLTLAGKQSLEQAAIAESLGQLREGLEWAERVADGTERAKLGLKLQLALFTASSYLKGPASPEATEALHRAEELCGRVGTDAERFSVLMRLRHALLFRGNQNAAIEKCWSALELAQQGGDPEMLAAASAITANTIVEAGRLSEALELARRAIKTAQGAELQRKLSFIRIESLAEITAADALALLGYPDQAEGTVREMLGAAERSGDVPSYLVTAGLASFVYFLLQSPSRVRDLLQPFVVAAEQAGVIYERARATSLLGWAIALLGDPEHGITLIRNARSDIRAVGAVEFVYTLPYALLSAGRYEEAIEEVDQALAELASRPSNLGSELYRIRGEAIVGRDCVGSPEAEVCFRTAIATARNQQSRLLELRATMSLARLLRDSPRHKEACAMLAEIYDWFTEGFDTADLKDAKALLDELSGSPRTSS
jgi:tetratricopeptide (TPR) repeat protein